MLLSDEEDTPNLSAQRSRDYTQTIDMGNAARKPKAGVEPPEPITQPKAQGAAQCCAIPGRFFGTIFYCCAGGFGFT